MDVATTAKAISDFAAAGALVVGGVWSYFKFARGQIFAARLEIQISQELHFYRDCCTLDIDITLHNIGKSRINLDTGLCVVEVSGVDDFTPHGEIEWYNLGGMLAFPLDNAVESGESVHRKSVAPIPNAGPHGRWLAFCADVTVSATEKRFRRTFDEWHEHDVYYPSKPEGETLQGGGHDHGKPQAGFKNRKSRDHAKSTG